jgi:hypothetical protein
MQPSFLHESGDRWQLDVLIPDRDRHLVGPQIPHTELLHEATQPVIVVAHIDPRLAVYMPLHIAQPTMCEQQEQLRCKLLGDRPLPGDRLL